MAAVTHTVRRSVQSRIVSSVAPQRPPPTYPAWVRLPAREDSLNGVGDGTTEVAVVLMSLPELWGEPRDTRADGRHVVVGGDVMATISSGSTPTIPSRRPTAMPVRSLPAAQCSSTGRQGAVAATCRVDVGIGEYVGFECHYSISVSARPRLGVERYEGRPRRTR